MPFRYPTPQAELAALQPVLEAKSKATADLLVKVTADQEQAEKVKKVVAAEERDVKTMQVETQAMADSAKADLEEALPALNAAIAALKVRAAGACTAGVWEGRGGATAGGDKGPRQAGPKTCGLV